jgi:hypothetical protein
MPNGDVTRLEVDGSRPAVAWVTALPPGAVTHLERLVLLVLACDSYDGETSAPGRDNLRIWCGASNNNVIDRALKGLIEKGFVIKMPGVPRRRITFRLALPDEAARGLSQMERYLARQDGSPPW